ncbi:MAG TPA: hypothetical protein VGH65_01585, partial [Verrucomicrobiaceae bacterium]
MIHGQAFLLPANKKEMKPTAKFVLSAAILAFASTSHAKLDFSKEILPLIESRCLKCHKAEHE